MENKKAVIGGIILAVAVVAGAFFYGGMRYGNYKNFSLMAIPAGERMGQNMNREARSGGKFQNNNGGQKNAGGRQDSEMSGFISGQVTSKDDKSFTVKAPDGNSKIVFYSDKTSVVKANLAGMNDVEVGQEVLVNGKTGADGAISAGSVQIK